MFDLTLHGLKVGLLILACNFN